MFVNRVAGTFASTVSFCFVCAASTIILLNPSDLYSQEREKSVGNVANVVGKAEVIRNGTAIPLKKGTEIFATDTLITKEKTAIKIQFLDGGTFTAFENASVKISEYKVTTDKDKVTLKSVFDVAKGKVRFFVKPQAQGKNDATYKTSNAVMGIRGTSGFIDASQPDKTQLIVLTGKVEVSNPALPRVPPVLVKPNEITSVAKSVPPTLPKPVSPALLNNLNSESARVDAGSIPPPAAGGGNTPQKEGSSPDAKQGSPDNKSAPESSPATEQGDKNNAPAKVEKKALFTPDGGAGIAVETKTADGKTVPNIAPIVTDKKQENQRVNIEQSASKNQQLIQADQAMGNAISDKTLKSVQSAQKATQVQEDLLKTKTQEATAPVSGKKNVRIKIEVPQ